MIMGLVAASTRYLLVPRNLALGDNIFQVNPEHMVSMVIKANMKNYY